jgi:GTPase SAR1 family protein
VYYKDAFGAMLVYDVSRPLTFETVTKWKEEIDAKVLLPNGIVRIGYSLPCIRPE